MIQKLDNNLINKIKAGEVVERVVNVVKELVENSKDASSTSILVSLKESGIREILVKDNGQGMNRHDAEMSLVRHATSKIKTDLDIESIKTLGFRGEALPSIASVSKFSLKTSDTKEGTFIEISGGDILNITDSDLEQGTTITVKNLFFNTPVRYKFLRSLPYELSLVSSYLTKMAIFNPEISFTLINDDQTLLKTSGSGDMFKALYEVLNKDIATNLIEVTSCYQNFNIKGFISKLDLQRRTKNQVNISINSRVVRVWELEKVIIDVYHEFIPDIKYPYIFLNIEIDERLVDVNIHPQKKEVRLLNIDEVRQELISLISFTLKDNMTKTIFDDEIEDIKIVNKTIDNNLVQFNLFEEELVEDIRDYNFLGIVFSTYLLVEKLRPEAFMLIDFHAAAERVNYELLLKSLDEKPLIVDEILPIRIDLSKDEMIKFNDKKELLEELSFNFDTFGEDTLLLRSYPNYVTNMNESNLKEIIELVIDNSFKKEEFYKDLVATKACRMSVKSGDYLSFDDVYYLLDELFKCDNPYNCPHGRPVIVNFTKYDVEKLFKRVMN